MVKYLGTVNNGIEIGIDVDEDGARDIYFGFYYDKNGKYAGIIGLAIMLAVAAWNYFM